MARHKPKYRRTVPKKKRRISRLTSTLMVIALMSALLTAAMTIGAVAKYSHQSNRQAVVRALEFYFTSDYLMPVEKTYKLNQTTSDDLSVQFVLRNYEGLKVSEMDINYTITLETNEPDEAKVAKLIPTTDTDNKIEISEKEVAFTLSGMKAGYEYRVTATGSNGYSKTLSAVFKVLDSTENIHTNTTKYKDYVILTIWAEGEASGELSVTVPDGLTPDRTDAKLRQVGNSITVSLEPYHSKSYRFFITGAYDGKPIKVTTKDGTSVTETSLS